MTAQDTTARERRASAREQRRSATDAPEPDGDNRNDGPAGLAGDALKAAASAAAVGAAVGAARALSARRRQAGEEEQEHRQEQESEPEATADQTGNDSADEAFEPDVRHEQEPDADDEPAADEDVEPASASELQEMVQRARALLRDLHGTDPESVSSVARTRHGWKVGLEAVEMRRIPDSTDVLATYEIELDDGGGILRFERTRRYHRAEADRGAR